MRIVRERQEFIGDYTSTERVEIEDDAVHPGTNEAASMMSAVEFFFPARDEREPPSPPYDSGTTPRNQLPG